MLKRGDLLKQLRLFQEMEFNKDKNSSGEELNSENDIKQRLWKEYSATKEEESAAKKLEEDTAAYVRIANARSLSGTIPSGKLMSGFEMMLTSCADNKIGGTVVILRKNERGKDAISRKKTRDKVVQALKPEISAGNLSGILTSTNADEYNVASKGIFYQAILNTIHRFCIQYDMETLLKIPVDVDLLQPLLVKKATKFFNIIKDWQQLNDKKYFEWQEFIMRYGTTHELESNSWLEDTLLISMDKNLRSEIESDMSGFPKNK